MKLIKNERFVYLNNYRSSVNSVFMKKSAGDRFKALLKEVGIRPSDFAKFCNTRPQDVNNWYIRGVPYRRMDEIASLLSVNSAWLRTGEGPKYPRKQQQTDKPTEVKETHHNFVQTPDIEIPLYKEVATHADTQQTRIVEIPGQGIRLPRHDLELLDIDPAQAICVHMIGNSMEELIQDGSILAIDRGLTQIVDGEIYAVECDGILRIRYLHRQPNGAVRLRSHNSTDYPDEIFSAEQLQAQNIQILGWVFWWSTLNKRRPLLHFE